MGELRRSAPRRGQPRNLSSARPTVRRRTAGIASGVPGSWLETLGQDRAVVARALKGSTSAEEAGNAVARLLDTYWRAEAEALLRSLAPAQRARRASLAYAEGLLATTTGATEEAIQWLTRAQSALPASAQALGARIALELGYIYALRGQRQIAEATLAWGRGLGGPGIDAPSDVTHLAALLETLAGNHSTARALYHQAVASSPTAFTPRSRVLALSNLAVSLTHTDPFESAHLSGLALATHRAHQLHPRAEPAMRNILGYALICCGQLAEAERVLESAALEARALAHLQAELYARFNLAIITELQGDIEKSVGELRAVARAANEHGLDELPGWCVIRVAWLNLLNADVAGARDEIARLAAGPAHAPAAAMVRALMAHQSGRLRTAADGLRRQVADGLARSDELSAFASGLWLAIVEHEAGRASAAARSAHVALTLGQEHGFRLSANWWAPQVVAVARRLAAPELQEYARLLVAPGMTASPPMARQRVQLRRDGSITINGEVIPRERWSAGRTGSRVLNRLFVALLSAYPSPLRRDELTDFMWPESEGDRAVANLYAATNDLRKVLADVPGVALITQDGSYALTLGPNVGLVDGQRRVI